MGYGLIIKQVFFINYDVLLNADVVILSKLTEMEKNPADDNEGFGRSEIGDIVFALSVRRSCT